MNETQLKEFTAAVHSSFGQLDISRADAIRILERAAFEMRLDAAADSVIAQGDYVGAQC